MKHVHSGHSGFCSFKANIYVLTQVFCGVQPASRWEHKVREGPYATSGYPIRKSAVRYSEWLGVSSHNLKSPFYHNFINDTCRKNFHVYTRLLDVGMGFHVDVALRMRRQFCRSNIPLPLEEQEGQWMRCRRFSTTPGIDHADCWDRRHPCSYFTSVEILDKHPFRTRFSAHTCSTDAWGLLPICWLVFQNVEVWRLQKLWVDTIETTRMVHCNFSKCLPFVYQCYPYWVCRMNRGT